MTWVDFVRKDTHLTGGIVNGLHGEVTRRFTERASAGAEYGTALGGSRTQGRSSSSFQDAGGVFRYRTGEATTFEASAGVAHLVDRSTRRHADRPVRAGRPDASSASARRSASPTAGATCRRWRSAARNQSQEARGYIQMPLSRNRLYLQESAAVAPHRPVRRDRARARLDLLQHRRSATRSRSGSASRATTRSPRRTTASPAARSAGMSAALQFVVSEPMRIR